MDKWFIKIFSKNEENSTENNWPYLSRDSKPFEREVDVLLLRAEVGLAVEVEVNGHRVESPAVRRFNGDLVLSSVVERDEVVAIVWGAVSRVFDDPFVGKSVRREIRQSTSRDHRFHTYSLIRILLKLMATMDLMKPPHPMTSLLATEEPMTAKTDKSRHTVNKYIAKRKEHKKNNVSLQFGPFKCVFGFPYAFKSLSLIS